MGLPQPCPGFSGNSDFYGLGIRLGVYLQLVSAWISNSLNPRTAGDNHNANSIFVFAIVVAIIHAVNTSAIRPIEAWIMIQTCFAFYFTTLSLFGLRLQFLS